MRIPLALVLTLTFAASCMNPNRKEAPPGKVPEPAAPAGPMTLTSPAFASNGAIPQKYTCNGTAVSPELDFNNVPTTALSLALEVTDPDAPGGTFDVLLQGELRRATVLPAPAFDPDNSRMRV